MLCHKRTHREKGRSVKIPGGWRNRDVSFSGVMGYGSCQLPSLNSKAVFCMKLFLYKHQHCLYTEPLSSLCPGVASPVKAPKALHDGLSVLSFLSREKKSCRMGIPRVLEFKKGGGDRIWRSLFVNANRPSAQPKSQSGVWLPGCSLTSKAVLALLGLEREARQGQMQKWTMSGERASFFTLPSFQTPFLCKEAGTGCCDTMPGASGQLFVRKKRVFTSIA